tara:strand:+ start:1263 stop:1526 length:264 start_codon:yes stop_codon:yes gene_type:complete
MIKDYGNFRVLRVGKLKHNTSMTDKARTYHVTVKSGDHIQTHEVQGEGESVVAAYASAVSQIAESFPSKDGHEIIGVKSEKGISLNL